MNKFIIMVALLSASLSLHAQTIEGVVKSVTGVAYVTFPGSKTPKLIKPNESIPVGSHIVTEGGAKVSVSVFPGSGFLVQQNSQVTLNKLAYKTSGSSVQGRVADLSLFVGSVSFYIDKNENKGTYLNIQAMGNILATPGTSGTVSIPTLGGNENVICTQGNVSLAPPSGNTVNVGTGMQYSGATSVVAQAAPSILQQSVQAVEVLANTGAVSATAAAQTVAALQATGINVSTATQQAVAQGVQQSTTTGPAPAVNNPANTTPPTTTVLDQTTHSQNQ